MPKYIASTTLKKPEWSNSTVLDGDVPQAISELNPGRLERLLSVSAQHAPGVPTGSLRPS